MWSTGDTILDLYDVRDVVASGGMGLVYRVHHRRWDIDLALKIPRPQLLTGEEGRRAFQAEAESWVALGPHPNIVNCAYVRRLDDLPSVFAEWVDGGTVADAVRRGRLYHGGPQAALSRAIDIAVQFAWGLDHAHAHGLIHQDVKPANVMLTPDGVVKVTDFGLAKARAAAGEPIGAVSGESVLVSAGGMTPAYCSPEQAAAMAGRPVRLSRATDVWSWALSVLELFVGGPPARYGPTGAEVLEAFLVDGSGDPALPPLPDGLAALLRRCLRPDPQDRPRDLAALAGELTSVHADTFGEPYPRDRPSAAAHRADGLSNHALSMLDLGQPERAEELWRQALEADPHHPHTLFNRGVHDWRTGRSTDAQVLADLRDVPGGGLGEYLTGLVHLERGDGAAAQELLGEAARLAPDAPDVRAALDRARRLPLERPPVTLIGHTAWVTQVALSPGGAHAATGNEENRWPVRDGADGGAVRIWDTATGTCLRVLRAHPRRCTALAFSPDGRLLASGGDDGRVIVWEVATGEQRSVLEQRPEAHWLALTRDGTKLASMTRDGAVWLWDLPTGAPPVRLEGPVTSDDRGGVVFTDDERHLLSWSTSAGRVRAHDVATGQLVRSEPVRGPVLFAGDTAVVVDTERVVVADAVTGDRKGTGGSAWPAAAGWTGWTRLAVTADARWVLAQDGRAVAQWDLAAGRCVRTHPAHGDVVQAVAVSRDAQLGISGGADGAARVFPLAEPGPSAPWSYARPRAAAELSTTAGVVDQAVERATAALSAGRFADAIAHLRAARAEPGFERHPDLVDLWAQAGRHGRRSGVLAVWEIGRFPTDDRPHLTADGGCLVTGPGYRPRQVHDVTTGALRHTLDGQVGIVVIGAGGRLAVGSAFEPPVGFAARVITTVRVWDLTDGRCRHVLPTGRTDAGWVAADPAGRFVVATDAADRVLSWELAGGTLLSQSRDHARRVASLDVTPDGRWVLVNRDGGGTCVLDPDTGRCGAHLPGRATLPDQVAVAGDGRTVVLTGAERGTLLVSDLTPGNPAVRALTGRARRGKLTGHIGWVRAIQAPANGRTVHTAGDDGTIRVWDLATGACVRVLTGHRGPVRALASTPDGRCTISAGVDGTMRVWDLATGACLRTVTVAERVPDDTYIGELTLQLSADSRTAASWVRGQPARFWQIDWDFTFDEEGSPS